MWFIWWLFAWIAKIITYVTSWLIGFTLYAFLILAGISGVLSITGKGTNQTAHYDPPFQVPGPVHPLEPGNLQRCAVQYALPDGALLVRSYLKDQSDIKNIRASLALAYQTKQAWNIQLHEQTLDKLMKRREKTYQLLVNKLQQATRNCQVDQQQQALSDFIRRARSSDEMVPLVRSAKLFISEAQAYQQNGVIDESRLEDTLLNTQ